MKSIPTLALSFLIISCGSKQQKATSLESRNFAAEREAFFSSLHNPKEISMNLIPGLHAFDSTRLNDAKSYYPYQSNDVKAAFNLGIYLSDLNYCILFKQKTSIQNYFEATYELSKTIGIEKTTLDFLGKRYADNIDRNDSVELVMSQLLEKATLGMRGTDRERLAGIAMAAYQIENIHLVLSELELFSENLTEDQLQSQKMLLHYIFNQQGKFEITYSFLKTFTDPLDPNKNPNYPFFNNALREVIDTYQQLIQDNPEEPGTNTYLKNRAALKVLQEKVNALRAKIVSND